MPDDISVKIGGDASDFESTLASLPQMASRAVSAIESGFSGAVAGISSLSNSLTALSLSAVGLAPDFSRAGTALVDFGKSALTAAGEYQQAGIAFTTMLGSASAAQTHLEELRDFAARTPFEFPGLVNASKRLQAIGFDAQQVIPTLTAVGNAASALGSGAVGIDRITTALGQMLAKGKVQAEEMRQLAEAAIPAWDILAKKLGTDVAGAMAAVEKRTVDAATAIPAILAGINERFGGLMEAQSKTLLGQWSNLKDQIGFTLTAIGQQLTPLATLAIQAFMPVLQTINDLVKGFALLPEPIRLTVVAVGALSAAGLALSGVILGAVAAFGAISPLLGITTAGLATEATAAATAATATTALTVSEGAAAIATEAMGAALTQGAVQLELFGVASTQAAVQLELFSAAEMQAAVAGNTVTASVGFFRQALGAMSAAPILVGGILAGFAAEVVLVASASAKAADDLGKVARSSVDWNETLREAGFGIADLVKAIQSLPPADAQVRASIQETAKEFTAFDYITDRVGLGIDRAKSKFFDLLTPMGSVTVAIKDMKDALSDLPQKFDVLVKAPGLPPGLSKDLKTVKYDLDGASEAFANIIAKQKQAEQAFQNLTGALAKAKDALAAGRITQAEYNAVLDEYTKASKKAHEQTKQTSDAIETLTLKEAQAAAATGPSIAQIQTLTEKFFQVPQAVSRATESLDQYTSALMQTADGTERVSMESNGLTTTLTGLQQGITLITSSTGDYYAKLNDLSTTQVFINGEWVKASELLKTLAADFQNTAAAADAASQAMTTAGFSADAWEEGFNSRSGGGRTSRGGGISSPDLLSMYATAGASSAQLANIAQALGLIVLGNNNFATPDYVNSLPTLSGNPTKWDPEYRGRGGMADETRKLADAIEASRKQMEALYPEWSKFSASIPPLTTYINRMGEAVQEVEGNLVSITPNLDNLANLDLSGITNEMQAFVTAGGTATQGLASFAEAIPPVVAAATAAAKVSFQALDAIAAKTAPTAANTPGASTANNAGPSPQAMFIPVNVNAGVVVGQGGMQQLSTMVQQDLVNRMKTNTGLKVIG